MATARRASEDRQVELVDAALEIIATRGIAALTTRSLAEQVGLSSGAIFRHFATLDALLEAVVARVEAVNDATYPPASLAPLARLAAFIDARLAAVSAQRGIPRLVHSEQFHLALPARGSDRLAACVRRSRVFVLDCLRDGQAAGEIRADLAPEALAPIVMGTMQALALAHPEARPRGADARGVADALVTLLAPPARAAARRAR